MNALISKMTKIRNHSQKIEILLCLRKKMKESLSYVNDSIDKNLTLILLTFYADLNLIYYFGILRRQKNSGTALKRIFLILNYKKSLLPSPVAFI